MALSQSKNYVTTLLDHSSDAQNNLYYVTFTGGAFSDEDVTTALTVRCSGFTLPETSQETYSVRFMNAYVNRPKPKVSLERTFTFTFRIDSQYEVYKKLLAQEKKTFDPYIGYTATNIDSKDENKELFNVAVYLPTNAGESTISGKLSDFTEAFTFQKCWISNVSNVAYKHTDSSALTTTVTVNYINFIDNLNDTTNKASNPRTIEAVQEDSNSAGAGKQ